MFEMINQQALSLKYEEFKESPEYSARRDQFRFSELAKTIINEKLFTGSLSSSDLTAFIQMFKVNCDESIFLNHLNKLGFDNETRSRIKDEFSGINVRGYTGVGLAAIPNTLSEMQLDKIKVLLAGVSKARRIEQVKEIIENYEQSNVPFVKYGIYSPWLYYLQPNMCPLITGPVQDFLKALQWDSKYVSAIDFFSKINECIGEKNLGFVDAFIFNGNWKKVLNLSTENGGRVLKLNGCLPLLLSKRQIVLYGPPGTGKTYNTKGIAVRLLNNPNDVERDGNARATNYFEDLESFIKTQPGVVLATKPTLDGQYSSSTIRKNGVKLAWVTHPGVDGVLRVHLKKASDLEYPSYISSMPEYKENGFAGYLEFKVKNKDDLEKAKRLIGFVCEQR